MIIIYNQLPKVFMIFMLSLHISHADSLSSKIDSLLNTSYREKSITPNNIVPDSIFLRRTFLSIAGRIPTPQEAKEFYASTLENKRHLLIDTLINSRAYSGKMFLFYADQFRLKTNLRQHGVAFHKYLYDAAFANKPYDKLVKDLIDAEGHIADNPAVGYYLRDRDMLLDNVSNTFQVFLGTQVGCAQCHDDPFSDTTQLDFYKLAAFSSGISYDVNTQILQKIKSKRPTGISKKRKSLNPVLSVFKYYKQNTISHSLTTNLKLPHDYQYADAEPNQIVKPAIAFEEMPHLNDEGAHKKAFAQWLTNPNNSLFTKVLANRLWDNVFGYPLADTLVNWNSRTKIANEEVLTLISKEIVDNNYNVRSIMQELYKTELFQRAPTTQSPAQGSVFDFHAPLLKRLSAEQLYDSLLTIKNGNVDLLKNNNIDDIWNKYTRLSNQIKTLSTKEIFDLGNQIIQQEKLKNKQNKEILLLKLQAIKATKEGDEALATKLYSESKILRKKQKNISPMDTMTSMETQSLEQVSELVKFASTRNLITKISYGKRSYEQPQPFYASSFVRKFGGSDGEISNSAHDKASITQALSLLNGNHVHRLTTKHSPLQKQLLKINSAEEKLNLIFLTLYSRYPTEKEKLNYIEYTETPSSLSSLLKAMFSSKQFLFIQ